MNFVQIKQELTNAFEQYGVGGDQSLEYYGLVIQDGVCSSSKIYRQLSRYSDEIAMIEKYRDLPFFQAVIRMAKIYDFSIRHDENGIAFTRLVFAPFRSVLDSEERFSALIRLCHLEQYADYFSKLTAYYLQMSFTGTSPLLKMGIELNEKGEVLEAKAYFALKRFDDRYDTRGKRSTYAECRHLVDKSLMLLHMEELSDTFSEIALRMEQIEYYPVFTGINFSEEYTEMKVYYETCFSDYTFTKILDCENRLASYMLSGTATELMRMNAEIQDGGVFIDCVSYSVMRYHSKQRKDVIFWKPYYLALSESLIRNRLVDRMELDSPGLLNTDSEAFKAVLLVNEQDEAQGFMQKKAAHLSGKMHRAFSVFLHDGKGNMLIQQRAANKYHSASLWTNACCSHPLTAYVPEEATVRLRDELGLWNIPLKELFTFHYTADVGGSLTENEIDHVLAGICTQQPELNPSEVSDQKLVPFDMLLKDVLQHPEQYTIWFRLTVERVIRIIREEEKNGN